MGVSIMMIQRVQGDRVRNKKKEPRATNRHSEWHSIPRNFPGKLFVCIFNKKKNLNHDRTLQNKNAFPKYYSIITRTWTSLG